MNAGLYVIPIPTGGLLGCELHVTVQEGGAGTLERVWSDGSRWTAEPVTAEWLAGLEVELRERVRLGRLVHGFTFTPAFEVRGGFTPFLPAHYADYDGIRGGRL